MINLWALCCLFAHTGQQLDPKSFSLILLLCLESRSLVLCAQSTPIMQKTYTKSSLYEPPMNWNKVVIKSKQGVIPLKPGIFFPPSIFFQPGPFVLCFMCLLMCFNKLSNSIRELIQFTYWSFTAGVSGLSLWSRPSLISRRISALLLGRDVMNVYTVNLIVLRER